MGRRGTCAGGQSLLCARESGEMLRSLEGVIGRRNGKLNPAARINPQHWRHVHLPRGRGCSETPPFAEIPKFCTATC